MGAYTNLSEKEKEMKLDLKFIELNKNEVIILPNEFQNPITKQPFDYIRLCGDYIVFGLSTHTYFENKYEYKTLREIYEENKR